MKAPILVVIISWILIILGILTLLVSMPVLLIGFAGKSSLVLTLGILTFIKGVLSVTVAVGLRKMRIWSIYLLTVLTLISVGILIYSATSKTIKMDDFLDSGIQSLFVIYLWAISKKFTK